MIILVADYEHLTCALAAYVHFHIYIYVGGRQRALGLADFVALVGGRWSGRDRPLLPGGPPPRLALVSRRVARVFRLSSLAPFSASNRM